MRTLVLLLLMTNIAMAAPCGSSLGPGKSCEGVIILDIPNAPGETQWETPPTKKEVASHWEWISSHMGRIKTPTGWIVKEQRFTGEFALVFVPDPKHQWLKD